MFNVVIYDYLLINYIFTDNTTADTVYSTYSHQAMISPETRCFNLRTNYYPSIKEFILFIHFIQNEHIVPPILFQLRNTNFVLNFAYRHPLEHV